MIRVHSIRLGHACNSSSTHSLIFMPEYDGGDNLQGAYPGEYGWQAFTLQSEEAKTDYFATQLYLAVERTLGDANAARAVVEQVTGQPLPKGDGSADPRLIVDHNSTWGWPRAQGSILPDLDFAGDLLGYLRAEGMLVLGGNDNGGSHPLSGNSFKAPTASRPMRNTIARFEDGMWTLFNQTTGARVRITFQGGSAVDPSDAAFQSAPYKPAVPELVDLKITNYCPYGCNFCYMGSTQHGKHSEMLLRAGRQLAKLGVFEVAIGGGEPTLHPHFARLVQALREADVVPNFTTRNLAWLRGPDAPTILANIGSFAYSVDDAQGVRDLARAMAAVPDDNRRGVRASVQVIEGLPSAADLKYILHDAHHTDTTVTLLGYKETGRGAEYVDQKHDYDWLEVVQQARDDGYMPHISIDTVIAARDRSRLAAAGVANVLYSTREGAHSMYVDAVEGRIGPSSFCDEGDLEPFDTGAHSGLQEAIAEHFPHW